MKNFTSILFSIAFSFVLFSQENIPQIEWEKTFGGNQWDVANDLVALPEGGLVVVGHTYSEEKEKDAWILKLDITGNIEWEKKVGGKRRDVATSISAVAEGGFVVAGYTNSQGAGNDDGWVMKFDSKGNIDWEKTYGAHGEERINAITYITDSAYIFTGYNKSARQNGLVWVVKIDQDGNTLMDTTFGGDRGGGIPTDVGNAITDQGQIAAHTRSFGAGDEDMWLLHINQSTGNKFWDKTYGDIKEEKAFDIVKYKEGLVIAGYTESKGAGSDDVWLIHVDGKGNVIREKTFGGHSNEQGNSIVATADRGLIIAGYNHSKGPEYSGMWIFKIDENWDIEWEHTFNGYHGNDNIHSIVATPDGGFAAAGQIWSKGAGKSDVWVAKLEGSLMKSINWYVEQKINPWFQKGEFEKTADYEKRISGPNMEKVKNKYTEEAINYYGSKKIKVKEAELSKYDADNENYTIHFPDFERVEVRVPINDAQAFKQNWQYVEFENLQYALRKARLILAKTDMVINGKTYTFNIPKATDDNQKLQFELTGESTEDTPVYRGSGDPLKGLNVAKANSIQVGKYYALIIGIDDYKGLWTPLSNAVRDAKSVEKLLRNRYRFNHFKTLYNEVATRESIINEFLWLVENVKENDNVLIYYSGHGEFQKKLNKGYWVPADAQTSSISIYISNNDIQTFLSSIKSKHTLLISDACFSGDIFRGKTVSVPFDDSEKYYKEVYQLKSCQAITSGGIEPVMDGGKDGHSVFAYYFLKTLNENTSNYLDAAQLFEKLKVPVVNNSDQSPKFQPVKNTGDEGGQFVFIRK
ncbi:MAG: hypothetical protein COA57_02310 [Flavobacteriales bacterium]|nr:caspase family protein [Bacteroidales bacterium AH-315-I05]PCJ89348.1 MAG: hypothetical protein COA57_02310 [Flavobacteriales bacterium]